MKTRNLIVAFVGAMLAAPAGASAQGTQAREQIQRQFRATGEFLVTRGYRLTEDIHSNSLIEGDAEDVWINLRAGLDYAIVGVCDRDCVDLNIELFDFLDNIVDSDFELDKAPVVLVPAPSSGRYRVRISLARCNIDPCFFGLAVYGRNEMTVARPDARWLEQIYGQIEYAERTFAASGFTPVDRPKSGSLPQGQGEDLFLELAGGKSYALVGVCDADCSDVDLAVYDEWDEPVDADYKPDDLPVVIMRPARGGRFRVRIYMAACSTEPCYWGVGVFGKSDSDLRISGLIKTNQDGLRRTKTD